RNAHEESRKGGSCRDRLCGRRLSWPSAPRRHCESESAAAEGKFSQRQGPEKSIAWVRNDGWHVHYEYEDQQRHSDQSRCQPRLDENGNTERRAKKSHAYQIDPKRMRGNPARNECRNTRRDGEMLGTEDGHGNRKKQPAKRHDLVQTIFLWQFPENLDEADGGNQNRRDIHPECRRRHAKRRGNE